MPLGTRVLGTRVLCYLSLSLLTLTSHSRLPEHTLTLLHTQTYKPQTLTPLAVEYSRRQPLTQLFHCEHTLTLLHTQTYKPQTLTPSAVEDSRRWPLTQLSHWGQLFSFRVTSFIWNFNGFKIRNIEKKTQSWCCVSINRSAKK